MKGCIRMGRSTMFNKDIKKTVVDLYHIGQSVKELSNEYGVSEITIYKWIKKYTPMTLRDGSTATPADVDQLYKRFFVLNRRTTS